MIVLQAISWAQPCKERMSRRAGAGLGVPHCLGKDNRDNRAKPGGPQLYNIKSQASQKCNLIDRQWEAEQLREFSVTLQKDLFPFDLPTDACHSQPHKTRIYEQVHPSAALPTASNHGIVTETLEQKLPEGFLALSPWTKIVELMKATLFNKSLPNPCGYQEEEFITQAYLYLLPEWSDQLLLDFVVSENSLSYIPLIARSPATFSFASYLTRDFPVQLSVSLVVSVKNTKKYQISATALHHKSCSHKQHGMTEILHAMEILFCSCWQHSLQVLKALTLGT